MGKNTIVLISVLLAVLFISCGGPATPNIPTYTLKYVSNGGSPEESGVSEYSVGELVSADPSGDYSRTNYTLLSWNTEADGSGVTYAPGRDFEMPDGDTVLYGIWIESEYLIFDNIPGDNVNLTTGTITQTSGTRSFTHTISEFDMFRHEVTYYLWHSIYNWAIVNGYVFDNKGTEGDDVNNVGGELPSSPSSDKPVTNVSWIDAVKWCNAYSEFSGLTPVYLNENNGMSVIKDEIFSDDNMWALVYYDETANGYSLPTEGEWHYAAVVSDLTPPITILADTDSPDPNLFNLVDLYDSIDEWCYDYFNTIPDSVSLTDYYDDDSDKDGDSVINDTKRRVLRGNINTSSLYSRSFGDVSNHDYSISFRIKRR